MKFLIKIMSACDATLLQIVDTTTTYSELLEGEIIMRTSNPLRTVAAYMRYGNNITVCKQIVVTSPLFTL